MRQKFPARRPFPAAFSNAVAFSIGFAALLMGAFLIFPKTTHAIELANSGLSSDANLTSYYRLEGNSNDAKGSNNGTDHSVSYATSSGKFGEGALYRSASSSYTDLGNLSAWNFGTNGFTLGAWIKTTSTGDQAVFMRQDDQNSFLPMYLMYLHDGNLYVSVRGTEGVYYLASSTGQSINDGNWHLVTLVSTGSGHNLSGYLDNGNQIAGMSIGSTTVNFSSAILNLGRYGHAATGNFTYYFNGSIDDAFVFNKALSTGEISELYNEALYMTSLGQYKSDGSTAIGAGGSTSEDRALFKATLHPNGSATTTNLQLQVEVVPTGSSFSGTSTVASALVSPDSTATTSAFVAANGGYHWQARVVDANGSSSAWQMFGPIATSTVDFQLVHNPTSVPGELYADPLFNDGNLTSYYRLEGDPFDSKGTNHGVDHSVVYATSSGKFGEGALYRSASSSYTDLGNRSAWNFGTGGFTLGAWIKTTSTGDQAVFMRQDDQNSYYPMYLLELTDGNLDVSVRGTEGVYYLATSTGQTLNDGNWHLVVLTSTGSRGSLDGYRDDGHHIANLSIGTTTVNFNSAILNLGRYGHAGTSNFTNYFNGDIDDAFIFNRALSPTDIANLYESVFYAKIQNGTRNLHVASSTSAAVLKTLPPDWVIKVLANTNASGAAMTDGSGNTWYKVEDPTDNVDGWMVASTTTSQYISSYDGGSQSSFEDMASTTLDDEPTRAAKIQEAVDHYYTNTSSTGSLYSSDDLADVFSSSSPSTTYPEDLIYPIAARESGGVDFDNEEVTFDYGHGIMQITPTPSSSDVLYLQKMLNTDPDTQVASSGPGSPGMETDHFGASTTDAVERFQTKYGLTPSGQVLFLTRGQLNSMLPTSSIPSAFRFERNLIEGMKDNTSTYSEARGIESGVFIPPCGNLQDPATSTYYQLCYGDNTSTNPKAYTSQPNYGNQVFKWYANTSQSIYSNIKDGLEILKQKYDLCLPGGSTFCHPSTSTIMRDGETFTYNDRLDLLATWGYNGFSSTTYLGDVANSLASIHSYFSAIPNPATSTGSWYNKLKVAQNYKFDFETLSPVEATITDSHGRTTGLVNGKVEDQIPDSAFDPHTDAGVVLFPNDTFTFKLVGTANDTYGFIVHSNDGSATTTVYQALNIPIKTGAIHSYTIDFNKLKLGQPGVTVKMDDNGDGKIDRTVTDIGTVSFEAPPKFIAPSFPQPVPKPKPKPTPPAPRIFQIQPIVPTSTTNFASSTQVSTSSFLATSSLENFTSTTEIASSTIQTNSSTENNE